MRIDLKIENGRPVLIVSKCAGFEHGENVTMYTAAEGHAPASRAYAARLKRPQTADDMRDGVRLLAQWATAPG